MHAPLPPPPIRLPASAAPPSPAKVRSHQVVLLTSTRPAADQVGSDALLCPLKHRDVGRVAIREGRATVIRLPLELPSTPVMQPPLPQPCSSPSVSRPGSAATVRDASAPPSSALGGPYCPQGGAPYRPGSASAASAMAASGAGRVVVSREAAAASATALTSSSASLNPMDMLTEQSGAMPPFSPTAGGDVAGGRSSWVQGATSSTPPLSPILQFRGNQAAGGAVSAGRYASARSSAAGTTLAPEDSGAPLGPRESGGGRGSGEASFYGGADSPLPGDAPLAEDSVASGRMAGGGTFFTALLRCARGAWPGCKPSPHGRTLFQRRACLCFKYCRTPTTQFPMLSAATPL